MKTLLLAYEVIKGRALANNSPNSTPKLSRKHSESSKALAFFFSDGVHSCFCCLVAYGFHFFQGIGIYTVMPGMLYYLVGVLKRTGSLVVE